MIPRICRRRSLRRPTDDQLVFWTAFAIAVLLALLATGEKL